MIFKHEQQEFSEDECILARAAPRPVPAGRHGVLSQGRACYPRARLWKTPPLCRPPQTFLFRSGGDVETTQHGKMDGTDARQPFTFDK